MQPSAGKSGPAQPADLLIVGCVVTMDGRGTILPDGAVAVVGGDIAAVGSQADIASRYTAPRRIGNERSIVIPGMIDAHTHCTACFTRSLTAGELPMIPRVYNPAQRCHPPEEAKSALRLIAAQLLRSGVTTVCEGSLIPPQEEALLETLEEVGLRCSFARGFVDQDFYHAALYAQVKERSWVRPRPGEAERDLAVTEALLKRYPPRGRQLIRGAVTASGLPGFSEGYFQQAAALARQHDATLQVHIDRDREEVELSLSVWGCRPIERLAQMEVIDEHLLVIHAVLATKREIDLLAAGGAAFAHSPIECICNLNAVPNLQLFRSGGVRVGLGCDNQANDMFETMRAAWLIHGGAWGIPSYDPEYLEAGELLAMATIEGARALRFDDIVGSIEVGKAADIVVLDGDAPHMLARQEVVTDLVRYATRAEVSHVMVQGQLLVDNGALTTIDLERLRDEAAAAAERVRAVVMPRRYRPLPRAGESGASA